MSDKKQNKDFIKEEAAFAPKFVNCKKAMEFETSLENLNDFYIS